MQNEDIDYISSDMPSVEADGNNAAPEDLNTLKRVLKYLDASIKSHNSLDAVTVTNDPLTTTEQIAVAKQVVSHLRNIRQDIFNKLSEEK